MICEVPSHEYLIYYCILLLPYTERPDGREHGEY